jgi:serine protease inhibitor
LINEFGEKVYQKNLEKSNGDCVISGLSIIAVLGFLLSIAKDREPMLKAMNLSGANPEDVQKEIIDILKNTAVFDSKSKDGVIIKQAVSSTSGDLLEVISSQVKDSFAETIAIKEGDVLYKKVNEWVNDATGGKISSIVEEDPNIFFTFVNIVDLQLKWEREFDQTGEYDFYFEGNKKDSFEMMCQTNEFLYSSDEDVQVIQLPYKEVNGKKLSCMVVLPNKGGNLSDIKLFNNNVQAYIERGQKKMVRLSIPSFKIAEQINLKDIFKELGVPLDLELSNGVKLSESQASVTQKNTVNFNLKGTEATVVTQIGFSKSIIKVDQDLLVNRPFHFVILDGNTAVLRGSVKTPEALQGIKE